jgi:hypothetical protein
MAERGDQDSGRDDAVILELAEAIGDTHWRTSEGTLYKIGDSETQVAATPSFRPGTSTGTRCSSPGARTTP